MRFNTKDIQETMHQAEIDAISVAYVQNGQITDEKRLAQDGSNFSKHRMFGAASLSKPVFSYLVLKLISDGAFTLNTKINDILPFSQFCEDNGFKHDKTVTNEALNTATIAMFLSHTSGLNLPNDDPINLQFTPGTQYSYSNLGIYYLQKAIEFRFNDNLQNLAQKHIFTPLHMNDTCYYQHYDISAMVEDNYETKKIYIMCVQDDVEAHTHKTVSGYVQYKVVGLGGKVKIDTIPWNELPNDFPKILDAIIANKEKYLPVLLNHTYTKGYTPCKEPVAVNSLFTTAHDYAIFINAWLHDKDELMQSSFIPVIPLTTDDWAKKCYVPNEDLKMVAWGLGWGLQTTEDGKRSTHAYHTADMNMWRAQVAIDLDNKRAIVYFANSKNGHILADQIITPNIDINHALNYFFIKYGFARRIEGNWEFKENERMQHIGSIIHSRDRVKSIIASIQSPQHTSSQAQLDTDIKPTLIKSVKKRASEINKDAEDHRRISWSHSLFKSTGDHKEPSAQKKLSEPDLPLDVDSNKSSGTSLKPSCFSTK